MSNEKLIARLSCLNWEFRGFGYKLVCKGKYGNKNISLYLGSVGLSFYDKNGDEQKYPDKEVNGWASEYYEKRVAKEKRDIVEERLALLELESL